MAPTLRNLGIDGYGPAKEIARGGSGVVYRCTSSRGDEVAIKVLSRAGDAAATREFEREWRARKRVGAHPNVVQILDEGATEDGMPFIVMPLLPSTAANVVVGSPTEVQR